jgi:hypothetical protein
VKADLKRIFCRVWHFHVAGVSSICQVEALALSASELAAHVKRAGACIARIVKQGAPQPSPFANPLQSFARAFGLSAVGIRL